MRVQSARWAKQYGGSLLLKTSPAKPVIDLIVHPCVVQQRLTLVHARDLQQRNPDFYQVLQGFAAKQGYLLLADRRFKDSEVDNDRRGGWLPLVALTCGIQTGAVIAQEKQEQASQATLRLFGAQPELHISNDAGHRAHDHSGHGLNEHLQEGFAEPTFDEELLELTGAAAELETVLLKHYQRQASDPDYIAQDIKQLAEYFSRYPQALALIHSLKDQPWQLAFKKDTFQTEVRGNRVQVRAVTVYFDSRAAAKLRNRKACITQPDACTASPADALLHELLHAESALLKPREFIAQGGLNSVIYPYAHEYAVIQREGELYRAMSSLDGQLRPHRNAHAGKLVASSCVTCVE
jgi:hypothetical protein